MNKVKLSTLLELFKQESHGKEIEFEFIRVKECGFNFYTVVIGYYHNHCTYINKQPNEIEIILDKNLQIMKIDFDSEADCIHRTPAWKLLCKALADDMVFDLEGIKEGLI